LLQNVEGGFMESRDRFSRRRVLALTSAAGAAAAVPAWAEKLRRTPTQVLGPFYPMQKPLDQDADLTVIRGRGGRAAGQVIHVAGRVVNAAGRALPGIQLEIWQANARGRYTHPSDQHDAPLDPNFEGYCVLATDGEGRYRFKTIKPGAYPTDGGGIRAPHIHFDVRGKTNRVLTQMYFAGERLNDSDTTLNLAGPRRTQLIAELQHAPVDLEPDSLLVRWDIVLDVG
jgi:protocatechuate 3,4-dioxygenase, beta subunit